MWATILINGMNTRIHSIRRLQKIHKSLVPMLLSFIVSCSGDNIDECIERSVSLSRMNAATYAVVIGYRYIGTPTELVYSTMGTAFAVGDRVLATNAHITKGIEQLESFCDIEIVEVLGVQSQTGEVVHLLQAVTHPQYEEERALSTPDVAVFTTQEFLPEKLPLATTSNLKSLEIGDEVLLVGFPGDVNDIFEIIPGESVPQATSLSGELTAFRTYQTNEVVDDANIDVMQHQAPSTPGTSGSALTHCGRVIAVNNAGTVDTIVTPGPNGDLRVGRTAAGNNNFGVHIKYIDEILELFDSQSIVGYPLPPIACTNNPVLVDPPQREQPREPSRAEETWVAEKGTGNIFRNIDIGASEVFSINISVPSEIKLTAVSASDFSTDNRPICDDIDTVMELVDAETSRSVAENDDVSEDVLCSVIEVTLPAGRYLLNIRSYQNDEAIRFSYALVAE